MQRSGWRLAGIGALVLAVTPALSGHAFATSRLTMLAVVSDAGHVLGAGGWLGSLLVLTSIALSAVHPVDPTRRGTVAALLVNRFSQTALFCVALTLITGIVAAWLHVGTWAALWRSTYGRTLLLKLGVLAFVVAVGAYNWRIVQPALAREATGSVQSLRRSATLELICGAAVIVVTAILMATPIPTE